MHESFIAGIAKHEFTDDGYWIPPRPRRTPGWGGVRHFRCTLCEAVTDIWSEYYNLYRPRACRACLLEGKRPDLSPFQKVIRELVPKRPEALEDAIRLALEQEADES
jgi:hypothetical protein